MQMIDVLKRLAELDAKNPNVVKESSLDECGMMPPMGMGQPHSPASINMTAASGPELSGMLRDIMQLAGVHGHDDHSMPLAVEPVAHTLEPAGGDMDSMRSVIDKLNPDDDDDGDRKPVDEYDNEPNDPTDKNEFDANQWAHQENQPGSGNDAKGQKRVTNQPTATYESLMKDWKEFIRESAEEEEMDEAKGECNHTPAGENCPVHGLKECGTYEGKEEEEMDETANESQDILKLAGLK